MGIILGAVFGLLLAAGAVTGCMLLYIGFREGSSGRKVGGGVSPRKGSSGRKVGGGISLAVAAVFLVLFIFIPFGFKQIETGEIAVVKVWGEAKETRGAGLQFRNIVSTNFVVYDLKTQQMNIDNEVYTKDAQPLKIQLALQYSIKADKVLEINRVYGTMEILATRIEKIAIEKAKVVLSNDTAMVLIETRAALSPKLFVEMKTIEEQYHITVENVVIVDMAFTDAFESAVEQKMIAEQEKLKAQYDKERAIIKAEQDLEVAKLDAEKALARAKGEADATLAIAQGDARALKAKTIEVARMLGFDITETVITIDGEDLLEYNIDFTGKSADEIKLISEYIRFIEYLTVWDGKLPQVVGDGVSILMPMP